MRHPESDRDTCTSRNRHRFLGRRDSPPREITPRCGKEFRHKKRNKRDYESRDKNQLERASEPSSSSIHSDYTSSKARPPSRSLSRSPSLSKSKSGPSKKKSPSSSSRSSTPRHSGSKTLKSHPTSRSMSPACSSLPVELIRHLSPPNKREADSKDSAVNAVGLPHSKDLFEGETLVRSGIGASRSANYSAAIKHGCEARPAKLEEEQMKKDIHEKDSHPVDNLLLLSVKGIKDSENDEIVGQNTQAPESDISLWSNASNSARLSSEEICMVLKHYGLRYPEENEKRLPVEIYFGSARSWPWEIIYYGRLKKGPVSAENYSRRIAQNEEFGIVDKYIRGSSGWGELNKGNS